MSTNGSDQGGNRNFYQLLDELGIRLKDLKDLGIALTHRSYGVGDENNERLEFLGDSVLSVIITSYLFTAFPGEGEGFLTKARAVVIREESLAAAARRLGYGPLIRLSKSGEVTGSRDRDSVLSDCFEAVLASIHLGCGYQKARDFALIALGPEIQGALNGELGMDFKTSLQELIQGQGGPTPVYRIVDEQGPDHDKLFSAEVLKGDVVLGRGSGRTKQKAEQLAAKDALTGLG